MKKFFGLIFVAILALGFTSCDNQSDGNLILLSDSSPAKYQVSFVTNGGTAVAGYKTDTVQNSPDTTRKGWIFLGWCKDRDLKNQVSFPLKLTANTVLYAKWTENTNTLYKVEHYKQSETFDSYNLVDMETLAGKTNSVTQAVAKTYEGYSAKGFSQSAIAADGSTVIRIYYDIVRYKVLFESNGGSKVSEMNVGVINESAISIRTGWILLGWCSDIELQNQVTFPLKLTGDTVLYAKWTENTNIIYKVEHYKQSESLNSYNLVDIEKLAGTTGAVTQAIPKNYEGFESKEFSQQPVAANASTVIKIYYNRIKYRVGFNANGGTGTMAMQDFYYGVSKILSYNKFSRAGYSFVGWATTADGDVVLYDKDLYSTDKDITLYAVWKGVSVSYKVEHYKQTTSLGDNYELVSGGTETLYGITGTQTMAVAKSYTGFTVKSFLQELIAGDRSTVIKIYYDREKYTVSFNANGGSGSMVSQDFYYGVPQALNANEFERFGYALDGWAESVNNETVYGNCQSITVDEDKELYAVWFYGARVTDSTINDLNLSNLSDECTIKVEGNITNSTLTKLAGKISQANKDVSLDLSGTKGLAKIDSISYDSKSVFSECEKLKTIVFPMSLSEIGDYAFKDCPGLSDITIDAVTVGAGAFEFCKKLTTVTIGKHVKVLKMFVFSKCSALETVTFKDVSNWLHSRCVSIDVTDPVVNATGLKNASDSGWANGNFYSLEWTKGRIY